MNADKPPLQQQTAKVQTKRALGAYVFTVLAVGFIVVSLILIGRSSPNKATSNDGNAATAYSTPSPPPSLDQIFKEADQAFADMREQEREYKRSRISADALASAYDANEIAADEKYKGKAVIVTGRIQNIGKDILGSPFVVVGGSGMLDGVQCMFPKSATSSLASLSKGRTVTISGTVSGKMLTWVMLSDCHLQ